ncbi:hypothetical protein [Oceanobacillus sp. Castelsardo]|uniref:hypothetical protein n=1 Tax=Oceanobacillus sp. Castelsardo TaxID=1851204 RepID=UPI000838791F|nr:hypothetical protein [Oceanobacillus sp. Castelsardo]
MRRMKQILLVFTAVVLLFPSNLVMAASNLDAAEDEGKISVKDEVIYATLSPSGNKQEIYVVNTLDVTKTGKITDYGPYTQVKNLTDLSDLEQKNETIEITAPKGKFYYQGNMDKQALPWNISISYFLNGKKISPEELAGKDGHVEIQIVTSKNEQVDEVFFKNYLLQISLTLDPSIYTNIKADDGMIANAGKNKQVTFTVMPEKETELTLSADVQDFELSGIDINGVPSSMSIDSPNLEDMTGDMQSLTNAIQKVNNGVAELKRGVSELNGGVKDLRNGSEQYKNGMTEVKGASSELVGASKSINDALATISNSLSGEDSDEIDLTALSKLPEGLSVLGENLNTTADGLTTLQESYVQAYGALDQAMEAIPAYEISEKEFQDLYASGAVHEVLDKLKETYSAAQTAKGTYIAVKEGFDAVDTTLENTANGMKEMGTQLNTTAKELTTSLKKMDITESITKLEEGLTTLSTNYKEFHSGLVEYTGGVNQLSNSYGELHEGIVELSTGTNELENGVSDLHNGTSELYEATNDLPDQIKSEVDEMISDFENTDFEAKSYVSPKNNEKINTVQFIIKTESIEIEEQETEEEPAEKEKSFWEKFIDLFS